MKYNSMGVAIRPDGYGRWHAFRLFLLDGAVVSEEQVCTSRSLHYALRDAAQALEMISHGLGRGKYDMDVSPPPRVKIT